VKLSFKEGKTIYFREKWSVCIEKMLAVAKKAATHQGIQSVVVATTRGTSGVRASEAFSG
jgi:hypothetical protein